MDQIDVGPRLKKPKTRIVNRLGYKYAFCCHRKYPGLSS